MSKPNPLDRLLSEVDGYLRSQRDTMDRATRDVRPFDSVELSESEEDFIFDNPAARYPGEPMTNAEAATRMLGEMGAPEYVAFVERVTRRRGIL